MMKQLVFATNNPHKLEEIRMAVGNRLEILSLEEIGCWEDIPETADTLEGNASQKSHYVKDKYGYDCFADDTGLEVEAIGGKPGVYSARYAGPGHDHEKNMEKLLAEMKEEKNRKCRFRTVISLIREGREHFFEGIVNGNLLHEKHGEKGFGYDPIFQPDEYNTSFAEMNMEDKNRISHRGKAIRKLIRFLQSNA